jgi:hypothetical protein
VTLSSVAADTIRVEAASRWDALDLVHRLKGMHMYLVQLGDSRWHVCVRTDAPADEIVPAVRRAAEQWARERGVNAVLRVGERTYEI